MLVVNKCDAAAHEDEASEFWALGLDEPICIAAEHGRGVFELWTELERRLPPPGEGAEVQGEVEGEIRIAVIGRPNIGKSTLVNRLTGEERSVVHDSPGTTMDAVDSVFEVDGQRFRIVDTAGVRRRARIDDRLESVATMVAIKTIERCHVTLLMLDGEEGPTTQDARLAALIQDRGRACMILINRWDLVKEDPERNSGVVEDELHETLPHLDWAPVLYISALTGKGCARILPMVRQVFEGFDTRVPTARLNRFLGEALAGHSPPQKNNHPVRIHYMTQARVRPPTFVLWSNSPDAVAPAYKRYLENQLRQSFGFLGSPLRIDVRKKRKPGEGAEEGP
jgi:GTP-binding protein